MKKRLFALLSAAFLALFSCAALAEVDMETSGSLRFSIGLDGNYEFFTTSTQDDYAHGELYIACDCGAEHTAGDLSVTYELIPAADCPYTMRLDPIEDTRVEKRTQDGVTTWQFTDGFYIDCEAKETLKPGSYPFTVRVSASCGRQTGTAVCTIELVISDSDASIPNHFGDSISELLEIISYRPDLVYQYDDMNRAVWFIQAALSNLGYYDGSRTGHYGFMTRDAVSAFQRAQGLSVSGKCDAKTMSRLFRLYLGCVETTYEPGYRILSWERDEAELMALVSAAQNLRTGSARLIDLWTDVSMDVNLTGRSGHLDAQPRGEADTRALCRVYGVTSMDGIGSDLRPALLVVPVGGENVQVVCAMQFHRESKEYICLYVPSARNHSGDSYFYHQSTFETAVNLMDRKAGRTLGTGSIVSGEDSFANMPPVEIPTLILPDGSAQNAADLLKYDHSGSIHGTITYNVHLSDLSGEEQTLLRESTLCFPYPQGLDQHSAAKYRIIIHHQINEKTSEVFKSEDGSIEFTPQGMCIRVKSFSPFAITIGLPEDAAPPQTGDHSLPLSFLALAAAGSFLGLAAIRKKRMN